MKIAEIAKLSNVSKSAVSLALNNKPGVSAQTRERILTIVRNSGYMPRSLVNTDQLFGPSKTICFLACPNTDIITHQYPSSTFFAELIRSIEKKCKEIGYTLIYNTLEGSNLKEEVELFEKEYTVGGIILLGTNLSSADIQLFSNHKFNLVVVDNYYEFMNNDFIVMNNAQGAYQAAKHLMGLGHKRIGYVQSHTRINNFNSRKNGFLSALTEGNLTLDEQDVYTVGIDIETARHDFFEMLSKSSGSLPSALFCESDYIAIGVVNALQDSGYAVPKNISVIGFDDVPQSTVIRPKLTTIHVDKESLGAMAVQRLEDIIENRNTETLKTMIDTELVERNSCRHV